MFRWVVSRLLPSANAEPAEKPKVSGTVQWLAPECLMRLYSLFLTDEQRGEHQYEMTEKVDGASFFDM